MILMEENKERNNQLSQEERTKILKYDPEEFKEWLANLPSLETKYIEVVYSYLPDAILNYDEEIGPLFNKKIKESQDLDNILDKLIELDKQGEYIEDKIIVLDKDLRKKFDERKQEKEKTELEKEKAKQDKMVKNIKDGNIEDLDLKLLTIDVLTKVDDQPFCNLIDKRGRLLSLQLKFDLINKRENLSPNKRNKVLSILTKDDLSSIRGKYMDFSFENWEVNDFLALSDGAFEYFGENIAFLYTLKRDKKVNFIKNEKVMKYKRKTMLSAVGPGDVIAFTSEDVRDFTADDLSALQEETFNNLINNRGDNLNPEVKAAFVNEKTDEPNKNRRNQVLSILKELDLLNFSNENIQKLTADDLAALSEETFNYLINNRGNELTPAVKAAFTRNAYQRYLNFFGGSTTSKVIAGIASFLIPIIGLFFGVGSIFRYFDSTKKSNFVNNNNKGVGDQPIQK